MTPPDARESSRHSPDREPGPLWLVRYGELALKSESVRKTWERQLARSIQATAPGAKVTVGRGRIWVSGNIDPERLGKIFGIVSFSPCRVCLLEDLENTLVDYTGTLHKPGASFALRVRRTGNHPRGSQEYARVLGDVVRTAYPDLRVDLTRPDLTIHVEIRDNHGYLYHEIFPGPGGLPPAVEGTLVGLLSGGIDSAVAIWMMMKRGCRVLPLFIDMPPFLGESAKERVDAVLGVLSQYQPGITLHTVEDTYVARVREPLRARGEERYTCLLCKRRMYRIAEEYAREMHAGGIVTGESMGQVASQTLDNLAVLNSVSSLPVYRPLIGFDKVEIVDLARKIGTYEPSIMPVSNCCCAVPGKPATRADPGLIDAIEERIAFEIG